MKRAKLSEHIDLRITYEMAEWIDGIAQEAGTNGATIVRSMLQTLMDEDGRDRAENAA